jgi:arylsulfatase
MLSAGDIIHDTEFSILESQHAEKWAKDNKIVDDKLANFKKKNGGKSPNIIYILVDDLSFGEMGIPEMNYVRGSKTPNINKLADESLSLMRMYTEPSCMPSRVAMMTGRHPIRNGMGEVKATITGEGLAASEVTIAEILSKAGYNTVHIGKWHMGDIGEAFPNHQGFDYASFPAHQQVLLALMTPEANKANAVKGWRHNEENDPFLLDANFKPNGLVYELEGYKGQEVREINMKPGEAWTQKHYDDMNDMYQRQTMEQLGKLAKQDKPFFLQYWPLVPLDFTHASGTLNTSNGGTGVESLMKLDTWVGQIVDEVDRLGIAENTMIVLMADNGRMRQYDGILGFSGTIYRGGKVDTQEGAVRVNAFARWPGMIEKDKLAGDMMHITDIFTTFARIGGAEEYIPRDRVIDGVDQSALFLNGEGNGRRDYVFIYSGDQLKSAVKGKYKLELPAPGAPGVGASIYDLQRDPRESTPLIDVSLWASASFQDMIKRHKMQMMKYPNAKVGKAAPYTGISNLRPESKKMVDDFTSWNK